MFAKRTSLILREANLFLQIFGIIFAANHQPKNPTMQTDATNQEMQELLELYNREIAVLKSRLLNGETWEDLLEQRKSITEIAIKLHKLHNHIVPEYMTGDTAELSKVHKNPKKVVD